MALQLGPVVGQIGGGGGVDFETVVLPSRAYSDSGATNGVYNLLTMTIPTGKALLVYVQAQVTQTSGYAYINCGGYTAVGGTVTDTLSTSGLTAPGALSVSGMLVKGPVAVANVGPPYKSSATMQVTYHTALIDLP